MVLIALASPNLAAGPGPIVVLTEGQRREILAVARGDVELLPLDQVLVGLGISVQSDPAGGAVTLSFQKHEVSLYNKKSLASVDGDLRLLSAAVVLEEGKWLVPVDSIPRLLGPLLGRRAEWRPASRVLVLGNVSIPHIGVSTFVSGDVARVVLEASEKVPFRVLQEEGRVTVGISRDLVDVGFQQQRLTGGIVDLVQFVGGRENLFAVTLGRRFQHLKAAEQESPVRLVLEFEGPPLPAPRASASAPAPRPTPTPEPTTVRTVVIDAGHGGQEVGAQGPGGTLEKDVTLALARKLRAQIVNNLGLQVFLTREKDEELGLDERTAIANNYKADLFVSIHANASHSHGANGSEVYFLSYQASDEEGRRMARTEGEAVPASGAPPGSDLALILWDMAQAEHLEESSTLASRIQEELAVVTGSQGRGVKQAPFRVLVGAAMPAVLVEVAFISNPEEEKLLGSETYQSKVAGALMRGVARYEQERTARTTFSRPSARAGQ
ncbi:MAG TPA: N-acetylmuramoyl-L-alanine amidase [Vicinamibacteria bacterium]|nr:N-acetylmuramoyl-L-alanine amidase [Vicinamibacteria bacterium]